MTKMSFLKFLFIFLTLFPVACAAGNDMVLEQKDIQFFKTEEIRNQQAIILKISGLAFHSSLAVSGIKTEQKASSLLVSVSLVPAREGLSGSFSFEVPIPASVKDVRFGSEKTVIWERK